MYLLIEKEVFPLPTEQPRVTITMSEEQLAAIRNYWHENKLKNQTQAILSLINKGFDALGIELPEPKTESAPRIDPIGEELLSNFTQLNKHGQSVLLEISDVMVKSQRYKQR